MADREPVVVKREIRLPDGRRLVFYEFPQRPQRDATAPPEPADGGGREEP